MKLLTGLLTLMLVMSFSYKKGCSGNYYINGTSYSPLSEIMKNSELTISIGKDKKTILTDNDGHFEISVHWMSACPSGLSKEERELENKRLNPEFIHIRYQDSNILLKNDWKKYGQCLPESKEEVTWKRNLHFSN